MAQSARKSARSKVAAGSGAKTVRRTKKAQRAKQPGQELKYSKYAGKPRDVQMRIARWLGPQTARSTVLIE